MGLDFSVILTFLVVARKWPIIIYIVQIYCPIGNPSFGERKNRDIFFFKINLRSFQVISNKTKKFVYEKYFPAKILTFF